MDKEEFELLKKLRTSGLNSTELLDIFYSHRENYRIVLNLIQHPAFPERTALDTISSFFSPDLIRIIKNKRTNPFIRKKCEIEFLQRYNKIPKGEKISYMRTAPLSLLDYFIEEKDEEILKVILSNIYCTEDHVIKLINRKSSKAFLYRMLLDSEWITLQRVCNAISYDREAPISIWLKIIPFIDKKRLISVANSEKTHEIIKKNIEEFIRKKNI
ncbi:MAG: hypothetical protein ABFR75_01600 [Acidobacteriota bacterium]